MQAALRMLEILIDNLAKIFTYTLQEQAVFINRRRGARVFATFSKGLD